MELLDLLEFRQLINEKKITLSFEGKMSQGILQNLVETLKEKLIDEEDDTDADSRGFMVKRIFAIFIELAQNIQKYSAEYKKGFSNKRTGSGIIVIREGDEYFTISSGNQLEKQSAYELKNYCNYINDLSRDEIKMLYKTKLREPRPEGQSSAGIGLLDITRKSGNPLGFEMKPIDHEKVFLVLTVKLNKEED